MKHITIDQLKQMTQTEGLILQGCAGDFRELTRLLNRQFQEEGIMQKGSEFTDVYVFEHEGLINLLFSMENMHLNINKLEIWLLETRLELAGCLLSVYLPNKFGIEMGAPLLTAERPPPAPGFRLQTEIAHPDYPNYPHTGIYEISLPATSDKMEEALRRLGIRNHDDVTVLEVFPSNHTDNSLCRWLDKALDDASTPHSLEELNNLAAKICSMTDEQRETFAAVLQARWDSDTLADILHLADNLDRYYLETAASSAKVYGEFLISMEQDDPDGCFTRLEESENPDDRLFAKYIDRLAKCADRAAYARMIAREEGGVFTDYGYLRKVADQGFRCKALDIPVGDRLRDNAASPFPTDCLNGKLEVGDLVLAAPFTGVSSLTDVDLPSNSEETFALLVGTVTGFRQSILSGKEYPTHNAIVDFTTPAYSEQRRIEVTSRLGDYYGRPLPPGAWPPFDVECAEMSLRGLVRITDIGPVTLKSVIESEKAAESLYRRIQAEHEKETAAASERQSVKVKVRPSLKKTLRLGKQKSHEQFGGPTSLGGKNREGEAR